MDCDTTHQNATPTTGRTSRGRLVHPRPPPDLSPIKFDSAKDSLERYFRNLAAAGRTVKEDEVLNQQYTHHAQTQDRVGRSRGRGHFHVVHSLRGGSRGRHGRHGHGNSSSSTHPISHHTHNTTSGHIRRRDQGHSSSSQPPLAGNACYRSGDRLLITETPDELADGRDAPHAQVDGGTCSGTNQLPLIAQF